MRAQNLTKSRYVRTIAFNKSQEYNMNAEETFDMGAICEMK